MSVKKKYLYMSIAILIIIFIVLSYLIVSRQNEKEDEELPEHLKVPLPNYPRQEFVNYQKVDKLGSVHEHAYISIYINGQQLDLSQLKYQLRDKFVHLEERRGDVIHKHATGVTIGYLLSTLGFKFVDGCLVLDNEQELCDDEDSKLKVFVNGKPLDNYKDYEFSDLDRILVSYGNESEQEIQRQIASVTDNAKVFSKKG